MPFGDRLAMLAQSGLNFLAIILHHSSKSWSYRHEHVQLCLIFASFSLKNVFIALCVTNFYMK